MNERIDFRDQAKRLVKKAVKSIEDKGVYKCFVAGNLPIALTVREIALWNMNFNNNMNGYRFNIVSRMRTEIRKVGGAELSGINFLLWSGAEKQ